ncbi:MAG: sigma-70 family RNA polymerase sigma factor [Desulfotomaculaceae bacterium]|nr:sigma-70 family RNA polymerase sigma factor [Desulfotomaculaceae bacterium]
MNEKILTDLYRKHVATVYRYLLSMCRHRETAEDLTQETFTRATIYLDKLKEETFLGWLLRIARNLYIDRWRKEKYYLSYSLDNESSPGHAIVKRLEQSVYPLPEEKLLRQEQRRKVKEVLELLPEKYRTALVLRDIFGISYVEIGMITRWSASEVKATIYQARQRFRKLYNLKL